MKDNSEKEKLEQMKSNALSDEDLEQVSGGWGGITIIDTCKKSYDRGTCWGFFDLHNSAPTCTHLRIHEVSVGKNDVHYIVSCGKSYFSDVSEIIPF